ncbi:MAG: PQQ-dependent sugar dehydrogenase [Balneolaceae bacterium]
MRIGKELVVGIAVGWLCIGLLTSCNRSEMADDYYFPLPEDRSVVMEAGGQSFVADTVLTDLEKPYSFVFLQDGRVLITERAGAIQVVRNGVVQETPVEGPLPTGLRDIELHPNYEQNGWIYISWYQEPDEEDGGYYRLTRGLLDGNRWVNQEHLYQAGPFELSGSHTVSRIEFDREGYLYLLVPIRGDRMRAQDRLHQSGTTMRFQDDGSIPEDNPFVGRDDALPEIYTWGHREHQGLQLHPETGELWSIELGEYGGDELNILKPGRNYGWPLASYSVEYRDQETRIGEDPSTMEGEGLEPPIHHWTPSIVPSGFTFITSDRYPTWKGSILVTSLSHIVPVDAPERLLNLSILDGEKVVSDEVVIEAEGRTRTVKEGPDGYIYFLEENDGVMVRLLPVE